MTNWSLKQYNILQILEEGKRKREKERIVSLFLREKYSRLAGVLNVTSVIYKKSVIYVVSHKSKSWRVTNWVHLLQQRGNLYTCRRYFTRSSSRGKYLSLLRHCTQRKVQNFVISYKKLRHTSSIDDVFPTSARTQVMQPLYEILIEYQKLNFLLFLKLKIQV